MILGTSLEQWVKEYPLLHNLMNTEEVFWTNPKFSSFDQAIENIPLTEDDVKDAEERLKRFAPYIAHVFPETKGQNGIIESSVVEIPEMKQYLEDEYNQTVEGNLMVKCDSHLAISGSIKARGGIYEVLKHAEDLARESGKLTEEDDYSMLAREDFREFFSQYSIAVGSTGNLGLSIGIMGAKVGFQVSVHMSADAKQWKKELLRSKGVKVFEYKSDYSKAVEQGREQSKLDPKSHFVDDENSKTLFLGYAVAAIRLKQQLDNQGVLVDAQHPLFVYLPCGVGGGPGGVAFGLKLLYRDHVHCFFAEPTHSPSMLIGLMTGLHDKVAVQDFGIDNVTEADGLAVGRPSGFVGKTVEQLLSGDYTVEDDTLHLFLTALIDTEDLYLEPSALAGLAGPVQLFSSQEGRDYINKHGLSSKMKQGTHLAWATGGSMVPDEEMNRYYQKGAELSRTQRK